MSVSSRDPGSHKPPAPVPMLKIGDETPTSASEPLVDEIASCLREWHSTKLHELLLGRQYSMLDKTSTVVRRLDIARRQLLHKVLTAQELEILRESTVWELVSGNKMLSGEVIVRSPSQRGRILVADDSAVEVTRLQSMMSLLDERPVAQTEENKLYHLLVDIKNFIGEVNHPTTVAVQLVMRSSEPGSHSNPISEVHAVDLASRERLATPGLESKMKTLFVDLSAADIGEGIGSNTQLYVIFSVLANEPFRSSTGDAVGTSAARESTPIPDVHGLSSSHTGSSKVGRRSLMWGQKGRKSESSDRPLEQPSPVGTPVQNKPSEPRPSLSYMREMSSNSQKFVKRTIGAGALRIDPVARQSSELEQDVILWTPVFPMDEQQEDQDDTWDGIISEFCPNSTNRYRKLQTPNRLVVHVKSFANPDAETLIKKTPTILQDVTRTRKIGFSGAPTKPRSDIYITLSDPFLPRGALLSHPKSSTIPLVQQTGLANLQLTLEVRKSTGERIENCIYPSCNSSGLTAWRTCAVERGQAWNVTIRLAMNPEDVPGSHIVMSIADAPEFPFALCWMPLWTEGAFVRDGDHSLALYKYDEYTSSMISGRGAYLGLPWNSRKKNDTVGGPIAALNLRTYLCSTKYSQDSDLLGLLKWREQPSEQLPDLLRRFAFVPEIEIVKLLNEVFDALFELLVEHAGGDEYEDLVFTDLVVVLGIVYDRRFKLAPLVDQYAEDRFHYPLAASCLLRSFNRLLADPLEPEIARKLRATFKVGSHILKFIMRARQQQREREVNAGITSVQLSFTREIYRLLESVESLMQRTTPTLIGTQTLVVQNFHTWLPEISQLLASEEVLNMAKSFVDACANVQGKLILYKLVLIINIVQLPLLNHPGLRRELFTNTVRWLAPYWGKTAAVNEQWKDQARLCCSVLASQVQDLGPEVFECIPKLVDSYRAIQSAPGRRKTTLSLLFPTSYPFPTRPTTTTTDFDEALIEIAAVLAEITNLPAALHLDMSKDDLADFLLEALQVYLSILDGEAFPKNWLSVHIYHHRSIMRSLEKLLSNLVEYFLPHPDEADQFNTELWRAFFDALLKLVGSEALALETCPEQKRRAVWKIAGDVRELGADLLRRSWEAIGWETSPEDKKQYGLEKMGGFQVQYVPGLVPPVVELCLSVHEGLRSVAIKVLQTMVVSEWTLGQDLTLIQAEIIDCLDGLFKSKTMTESVLQKLFIIELLDLFEPLAQAPDDGLFVAVKSLIATVDELLDLLAAVHSPEASGEAFYIMNTLHLMDFLKDIQKEDIYIRYVHQLAGLQASARHFTEAGLALRLHADLYEWDPALSVTALQEPEFPAQTSFDRKEQLYFQMIKYFEEGQSWNDALGTYTELATQYERNVFDFAKLARTHRAMATIYETMSRGGRHNPRYFRVVYKGLGFPVGLRDKQYIFQGSPSDRLATFTDRMQQQHPSAQILPAGSEEELEGQYLQIYPVSPQRDLFHPVYQRWKVAQPIRDYFLVSKPRNFTTTSRRQPSDAESREATVEKTVYTTAESFPTILRRSEVVSISRVVLTPIQTAVERTTRKTSELLALEKRVAGGDDAAYTPLTEALMIAVDPKSESSVFHYRVLLPATPEPVDDEDDVPQQPVFSPLETALKVALVDHALAIKRCLALYHRSAHQATRADLTQRKSLRSPPSHQHTVPLHTH